MLKYDIDKPLVEILFIFLLKQKNEIYIIKKEHL